MTFKIFILKRNPSSDECILKKNDESTNINKTLINNIMSLYITSLVYYLKWTRLMGWYCQNKFVIIILKTFLRMFTHRGRHYYHQHPLSVCLSKKQTAPAKLIQTLLIMAGIESNPGPNILFCSVCKLVLNKNRSISEWCNNCNEWYQLQFNCNGLNI